MRIDLAKKCEMLIKNIATITSRVGSIKRCVVYLAPCLLPVRINFLFLNLDALRNSLFTPKGLLGVVPAARNVGRK